MTVDEVLNGTGQSKTKTMVMEDELRAMLTDWVPAEDVLKRAKSMGISERTLKIAKKNLGVIPKKIGDRWFCKLPDQECKSVGF